MDTLKPLNDWINNSGVFSDEERAEISENLKQFPSLSSFSQAAAEEGDLVGVVDWSETEQGFDYWDDVYGKTSG